jgi:hypothetical protein
VDAVLRAAAARAAAAARGGVSPDQREGAAALGIETGMSHMEWFLRADGSPIVSEVGARPPGVHLMPMMGMAHEVDMWAKWAS